MRLVTLLLWCMVSIFAYAQSQNGSDLLNYAIEKLPPCALNCTLITVSGSDCELSDFECIKHNEKLLDDLSGCVRADCSIRNALTAKKFLAQLMNAPVRNKSKMGTLICLIVGGFCVLTWIARVIARLPIVAAGQWGPDDWVMAAAMVIIIPLTFCAYILNQIGLGQDMWMVPFENITKVLEVFYYTELLYLTAISLTKISILLFYLRIFPQRNLRRAIYVTIVFCVLYIIVFVLAAAIQCIPVRMAWERWDGEHNGQCINFNRLLWASAGINMVLDLVIIILPVRETAKLAMSRRRRFGVMCMFLGGGFVTIVSVLRLGYVVEFAQTTNVTWDYMPVGIWSAVETHVGVMVACMPALRSLQTMISARFWPKAQQSSSYYEDESRDNSKRSYRKNSKALESKSDRSRLSTLNWTKADKQAFVELNDYGDQKTSSGHSGSPTEGLSQSFSSNEDILPLATTPAPTGQRPIEILVQTEYSVNRETLKPGHFRDNR